MNPLAESTRFHAEYATVAEQIARLSPDVYHRAVFCHPMAFYRERVNMAGCEHLGKVFDAGHGFGQWSIALSEANSEVLGIDAQTSRVRASQLLLQLYSRPNVEFKEGSVYEWEPKPGYYDLVWCWGTIQYVRRPPLLRLSNRALRMGGTLFLGGVDTRSRLLLRLWWSVRTRTLTIGQFKKYCTAILRGGKPQVTPGFINLGAASSLLAQYGFRLLAADYDGCIDRTGKNRKLPFEPLRYNWMHQVEFLAEKYRECPDAV
jgi:2-polyprenyl-3-methyl-5-hydroxy-6-metoxy-1,4-benzoquinol methylase